MYRNFFKRFFDFWIALLALVILSPLMLVMIVWLRFANKGAGVFFTHQRPGYRERIFKVIKFKTMTDERDENGNLLPDVERITPIGRVMRSTSLDEIPQLINVLKGDMALIGPRPLLVEYLPLYSLRQARRHGVRPGITGWAQVNGRNTISWRQKFEHDIWYVDNLSLSLDIRILFMTIRKVFAREGINQSGQVTMEMFDGKD